MGRRTGIVLALFALSACESIVDLKTPSDEHRIVAQSFFTPDSVWTVDAEISIHTSGSPVTLSSGDPTKTIVVVSDDQGGVDTLRYHRGATRSRFRSARDMRPRSGVTYTLQIAMPGFISSETMSPPEPVEASARLPERVSMRNVAYSNEGGMSSLRFSIEDPPGENYYRLELFQAGPEGGAIRNDTLFIPSAVEDVFNYRRVIFRSEDPAFRFHYGEVGSLEQSDEVDFNFPGRAVFSDDLFDGTSRDIEISFQPYDWTDFDTRFTIILSTLSTEIFSYLHTLDRHGADVGYYASEVFPVAVYTNIKNGYGVFGGYVRDVRRFDGDGNEW